MEWKYKGWIITEYYDAEGYRDEIIYARNDDLPFTESTILSLLRMNTPNGVVWKELERGPLPWIKKWHSLGSASRSLRNASVKLARNLYGSRSVIDVLTSLLGRMRRSSQNCFAGRQEPTAEQLLAVIEYRERNR